MPATGAVTFGIHIAKRGNMTEIMEARLRDMSPAFNAFIGEWARHNADKFRAGAGMEGMGVDFVPEPSWQPLTDAYHHRKQVEGYADHLMVRTGDLQAVMTNEETFFRMVTPTDATFGSPMDPEDVMKVKGNWERRQAIFLDQRDMNSLRKIVQGYVEDGPDFKSIRSARAAAVREARDAEWAMDYELTMMYRGEGGAL